MEVTFVTFSGRLVISQPSPRKGHVKTEQRCTKANPDQKHNCLTGKKYKLLRNIIDVNYAPRVAFKQIHKEILRIFYN